MSSLFQKMKVDHFMLIFLWTEARTDQEKERLANLMAYGTDPTKLKKQNVERTPTPPKEIDRFDERKSRMIVVKAEKSNNKVDENF